MTTAAIPAGTIQETTRGLCQFCLRNHRSNPASVCWPCVNTAIKAATPRRRLFAVAILGLMVGFVTGASLVFVVLNRFPQLVTK